MIYIYINIKKPCCKSKVPDCSFIARSVCNNPVLIVGVITFASNKNSCKPSEIRPSCIMNGENTRLVQPNSYS